MDKQQIKEEKLRRRLQDAMDEAEAEYVTPKDLEEAVGLLVQLLDNLQKTRDQELADGWGKMARADKEWYDRCEARLSEVQHGLEEKMMRGEQMTRTEVQDAIESAVKTIQAQKGDKGDKGDIGAPGKDGSPDTPEQVVEKVNTGKTLIKKERVEGLADIERMAKANAEFNPTMGPSFSDLADIRRTITTVRNSAVTINYIIDGGGSAITTGVKGFVEIPYPMTITGWQVFADQSGSVVVDVWKSTYATFPPVVGGSIAGSELPTLSSQQVNQDSSLTTWITSLSAGDVLAYNVNSASTVTRITVSIIGNKI